MAVRLGVDLVFVAVKCTTSRSQFEHIFIWYFVARDKVAVVNKAVDCLGSIIGRIGQVKRIRICLLFFLFLFRIIVFVIDKKFYNVAENNFVLFIWIQFFNHFDKFLFYWGWELKITISLMNIHPFIEGNKSFWIDNAVFVGVSLLKQLHKTAQIRHMINHLLLQNCV